MQTTQKTNVLVIIIAAIASTGGLLFGFDTGVISGAIPFLETSWALSSEQIELITAGALIGAVIGAAVTGRLTDIIGRKKIILITSFIFAAGSILTGIATNVTFLILSRVLLGLAIGISSFSVPLYISEISPTKVRGTLVSSFQLMITIGIVASYLSDLGFADESNPFSWRWMFYVGVFPALILFVGMLFLPDTPRFLIGAGKEEEGKKVLKRLEGEDHFEEAYNTIKAEIEKDKKAASYSDIFKKVWRFPLLIALGITFIQQFIGINTVIYYAPKIFIIAGFDGPRMAILATVIVGIVNVVSTIISMAIIDKLGRRKLYFSGLIGMALALGALGVFFIMKDVLGDSLRYITVGAVLFYILFFALSLGPLTWLIISEVFPLKIRGVGMSIGSLSIWFFNAIVAYTFLKIATALTIPGTEIKLPANLTVYQINQDVLQAAKSEKLPAKTLQLMNNNLDETYSDKISFSAAINAKESGIETEILQKFFEAAKIEGAIKITENSLNWLSKKEIPMATLSDIKKHVNQLFLSKDDYFHFMSSQIVGYDSHKALIDEYFFNKIEPNPAGSFFIYAIIAIIGILWGLKYIPETKGVSLEHIEEHWRQGKKPREL